jgi:hypothetical protein
VKIFDFPEGFYFCLSVLKCGFSKFSILLKSFRNKISLSFLKKLKIVPENIGQKLTLLGHSGKNGICLKLLFNLFSITMGQKYAKILWKSCWWNYKSHKNLPLWAIFWKSLRQFLYYQKGACNLYFFSNFWCFLCKMLHFLHSPPQFHKTTFKHLNF